MEKYESMKRILNKYLYLVAIFFLFWAAVAGVLMRFTQIYGLSGFVFDKWLHGHSHVAFLGWGFLAALYLLAKKIHYQYRKIDFILFMIMIMSILGMLITFPIFGYKLIPILFLVAFLLASYYLLYRYLKFLKLTTEFWLKWVKSGIWFYYISSLAIWVIPVVMVKYDKGVIYYNLVYFYLHFLYNGFFSFVLWGLIFNYLKENYKIDENRKFSFFYNLLLISVIPTYVLSLYWNPPHLVVQIIGITSSFLQILGVLIFISEWWKRRKQIFKYWFFNLIFTIFIFKIFMQFLSSFYSLSAGAIALKPYFVVGYLHWFTLGFMSLSLFWLSDTFKNFISKIGLFLFVFGFILTELTLFYNGAIFLFQWKIPTLPFLGLLHCSILMLLGIIIIAIDQLRILNRNQV